MRKILLFCFGALVLTACSPGERSLWLRWWSQDPTVASQAISLDVDDNPVLDPVSLADLTLHVDALEAQPDSPREIAIRLACERWGCDAFAAIDYIITRESGYNPAIVNRGSGACGIPQALPCSKLPGFPDDAEAQIRWMFDYVDSVYGGPWNAQAHWRSHGWY